jgi:hypothetical protein
VSSLAKVATVSQAVDERWIEPFVRATLRESRLFVATFSVRGIVPIRTIRFRVQSSGYYLSLSNFPENLLTKWGRVHLGHVRAAYVD